MKTLSLKNLGHKRGIRLHFIWPLLEGKNFEVSVFVCVLLASANSAKIKDEEIGRILSRIDITTTSSSSSPISLICAAATTASLNTTKKVKKGFDLQQ